MQIFILKKAILNKLKHHNIILLKKGFTLFELLLSISLVSIIAVFSIPITKSFLDQNELDGAFRIILTSIRKSQIYSITGKNDSAWGTKVENGKVTVFSGNNFASRASNFDEISGFSNKVSFTGTTEFVFTKLLGETTNSSISITSSSKTKIISVNPKGIANY